MSDMGMFALSMSGAFVALCWIGYRLDQSNALAKDTADVASEGTVIDFLEKLRPLTEYGRVGTRDVDQAELQLALDSAIKGVRALLTTRELVDSGAKEADRG